MTNNDSAHQIVTLDGPAGVGKTTLARRVADHLAIAYLDTGAMYRAVALALGGGAWKQTDDKLKKQLKKLRFTLRGSGAYTRLLLDGVPLGDELRTEEVGKWASNIATLPVVRLYLTRAQQAIGRSISLAAEGRDMGTVVFPDASHKFFLDAAPEVRAQRRVDQYRAMGREADFEEILESIRVRDEQDRNREEAPLIPAKDAVVIDTSELNKDEVFRKILEELQDKPDR